MPLTSLSGPAATNTIMVTPGMDADQSNWPEHDIRDDRNYAADFTKWLKNAPYARWDSIATGADTADTKLIIWPAVLDTTGTIASLRIIGGTAGLTTAIGLSMFAGGESVEFVFGLSVVDRAPGLVALGTLLTIGGVPIEVGDTPILVP